MLDRLKELNENVKLFDVYSEEFSEYGRVLNDVDVSELIREAQRLEFPESGSVYLASVDTLEATEAAARIKELVFGTLDTQIGYCYGYSNMLNAAEWHFSSELNVAVTPLVLILGTLYILSLLSNFAYNRMMAVITQRFLYKLRKKMFEGLQNLPIRYFDTHKNGDIMSHYTNDIDTVRNGVPFLPAASQLCRYSFDRLRHYALFLRMAGDGGCFRRLRHDLHFEKIRWRLGKILRSSANDNG